jgi:hypothetical protein
VAGIVMAAATAALAERMSRAGRVVCLMTAGSPALNVADMKLLIASLIAAAVTASALGATASGRVTTRLRFVQVDEHFKFVDVAPKGGERKPPSLGDEFVIAGRLMVGARRVGSTNLVCTVTQAGAEGVNECHGSAIVPGGSITIEGSSHEASNADVYAITGGTGRYADAQGTIATAQGKGDTTVIVADLG